MKSLLSKIDKYLYTDDRNDKISTQLANEISKSKKKKLKLTDKERRTLIEGGIIK